MEALEPSEEKIFFIADSHRPYDVCNIYNDGQICLLGRPNEKEGIPAYEDIFGNNDDEVTTCTIPFINSNSSILLFQDDSDHSTEGLAADEDDVDEDDDDDEEGSRESLPKRRKLVDPAERVMRRREKRLWHEKRKEILFSYMQFSFYSSSVIFM